jgi:hypothetical protein
LAYRDTDRRSTTAPAASSTTRSTIAQQAWRCSIPKLIGPPPWIDPDQTPIRNTYPAAVEAAHKIAQQILLDLDPPPDPRPDTG